MHRNTSIVSGRRRWLLLDSRSIYGFAVKPLNQIGTALPVLLLVFFGWNP
jgi:hypothetical protein